MEVEGDGGGAWHRDVGTAEGCELRLKAKARETVVTVAGKPIISKSRHVQINVQGVHCATENIQGNPPHQKMTDKAKTKEKDATTQGRGGVLTIHCVGLLTILGSGRGDQVRLSVAGWGDHPCTSLHNRTEHMLSLERETFCLSVLQH